MSTYRSRALEQRAANDHDDQRDLMCAAQGCPHRWSVDAGSGRLCSAHAWSDPHQWPRITQEQIDRMADRAMRAQQPGPPARPVTTTEKRRILQGLLTASAAVSQAGRKDWAHRIVERAEAGECVSPLVLRMAQAVTRKARTGEHA